jgi:hypothetical protein
MSISFGSGDEANTLRFHLYKPNVGSKGQVDIVATNLGPTANNCAGAKARVLALNTEE